MNPFTKLVSSIEAPILALSSFTNISGEGPAYRSRYFLIAIFVATFVVFPMWVRVDINGYSRAMFGEMVYGEAYKPFVTRALLPTTVRLITASVPSEARAYVNEHLYISISNWEQEYFFEYLVALILMWLSLLGFLFAIRYLFTGTNNSPGNFADLVPLVALLCLPTLFIEYSYIYDFPTLFLFTLALGLMVRGKWAAYLPIFFFATLSKETSILLIMVFAIYFFNRERLDRSLFKKLLLLQLGVYAGIRLGLLFAFRDNPGGIVEFHLFDYNFRLLRAYSIGTLLVWLSIILLVSYRWSEKSTFLKHGLWVLAPLLILTLLFGQLDELRDYYEAYPFVILLAVDTLAAIIGVKLVQKEPLSPDYLKRQ